MLTTSNPESRLGPMSPDVLIMFNEAQRNIAELNRSRLNALDQLRAAKDRISDLEVQLLDAREQQAHVQQLLNGASCSISPRPTTSSYVSTAVSTGVTVFYETGWENAYLHFNADGNGWTSVPGEKMGHGTGEYSHCKALCLPAASRVEFVINNGSDEWDKPFGVDNYVVEGPGLYCIRNGAVEKLQ